MFFRAFGISHRVLILTLEGRGRGRTDALYCNPIPEGMGMKNLYIRCLIVISLLSFPPAAAFGAVSLQQWNSGEVRLLATRSEVMRSLGTPDGVEDSVEWYDISGEEGLLRGALDYLDGERVQAVHLAFRKDSVDLETLSNIIRNAFPGVFEVHRDGHMVIFLGKAADGEELLYFLALAGDPLEDRGPELITMTEAANRHYQEEEAPE